MSTGHASHKFFAKFHIALREFGEAIGALFFPAMKYTTDEHHCSALERQHGSQKMLFKELGVEAAAKQPAVPERDVVPEIDVVVPRRYVVPAEAGIQPIDEDTGAGVGITASFPVPSFSRSSQ